MPTKIVQVKPLILDSNIGTSNTTAIVSGMVGLDGVDLVQADFGSIIYGTFEPNTPREEAVSFTITSCVGGVANIDFGVSGRGLIGKHPYGTGGITYAHSAGVKLVISNNPNLFNKFTAKDNDEEVTGGWKFPATPVHGQNPATKTWTEAAIAVVSSVISALDAAVVKLTGNQTIAGVKTFSSSPVVPTATNPTEAVNKSQVEAYFAANSGDVKASQSIFGTVKLNEPADDIAEPKAVAATTKTQNFISAITGMIIPYASATPPTGFLNCDGSAISRTTYANLFAITGTNYGAGDGSTTFNLPDLRSRFPLGYSLSAPVKVMTFSSRASNIITVTGVSSNANSEMQTGQMVRYSTTGTVITGLTNNTDYYVIRVSSNTLSLATSVANANEGTAIALTGDGSGTQTFTITYTARPVGQGGGEETHALTNAEMPSHVHGIGGNGTGTAEAMSTPTEAYTVFSQPAGSDTPHNIMPLFTVVNYIIKT
jgi:microcystin-dependent protein